MLRDTHSIFESVESDRFASAELCRALNALEESPWGGWPLEPRGLARLLRPYGVKPRAIRLPDGSTPRGYLRSDLVDAWDRYLPESATTATSATPIQT